MHGLLALTLVGSIPEREMQLWTEPGLRQRISEGLEQAAHGKTHDRGDFSPYLEDTDEDWQVVYEYRFTDDANATLTRLEARGAAEAAKLK
ncbi:hypothetical protein QNO07_16950 [Streptomyces sp. 549]|uniref:hypothetical protein n=1 Tax=Streptomyces sp. 549 TaxID=3049076 RepID=UPI0024C3CC69|nr:hypothetical protein [Streptomyces sp. 549]MDK1475083.1 hypothetical protein [Streptomyces sp. 549]